MSRFSASILNKPALTILHNLFYFHFLFYFFFWWSDSYLSQNTWKVHEEFSLMMDDLERDIPHPGRRRYQALWQTQSSPHENRNRSRDSHSLQQISVANGIFFQNGYSIRDDYRSAMESAYKAHLQRLDFANKPELSTKYINRFVDFDFKWDKTIKLCFEYSISSWSGLLIFF